MTKGTVGQMQRKTGFLKSEFGLTSNIFLVFYSRVFTRPDQKHPAGMSPCNCERRPSDASAITSPVGLLPLFPKALARLGWRCSDSFWHKSENPPWNCFCFLGSQSLKSSGEDSAPLQLSSKRGRLILKDQYADFGALKLYRMGRDKVICCQDFPAPWLFS